MKLCIYESGNLRYHSKFSLKSHIGSKSKQNQLMGHWWQEIVKKKSKNSYSCPRIESKLPQKLKIVEQCQQLSKNGKNVIGKQN